MVCIRDQDGGEKTSTSLLESLSCFSKSTQIEEAIVKGHDVEQQQSTIIMRESCQKLLKV